VLPIIDRQSQFAPAQFDLSTDPIPGENDRGFSDAPRKGGSAMKIRKMQNGLAVCKTGCDTYGVSRNPDHRGKHPQLRFLLF
jgi:hypothetical protein